MIVQKTCVAADTLLCRNVLYAVDDKTDKPVPLAADAIHYGNAVDVDLAGCYPEFGRLTGGVRGFSGCDEQFAWHAANPGAGGAVRPAFDEDHVVRPRGGGTECGKACRPGADDGDVNITGFHAISPSILPASSASKRPEFSASRRSSLPPT